MSLLFPFPRIDRILLLLLSFRFVSFVFVCTVQYWSSSLLVVNTTQVLVIFICNCKRTIFCQTTRVSLLSDCCAWRQVKKCSLLFQFVVNRGPCVLVQRIAVNIAFLLALLRRSLLVKYFFDKQIRVTSDRHAVRLTPKFRKFSYPTGSD